MKLLLLLPFGTLLATAQEPLSLRDAVRQAVSQNKSIEAAKAAADKSGSAVGEAHSGSLPKVNYTESWARSDNPVFVFSSLLTQHQFGAQDFQLGPLNRPDFLNNFQSTVTADEPLYDGGRTKRAVQSAEIRRDAAREETRRSEFDVMAQTARAYYDAQVETEELAALDEAMRSAQADLTLAQNRTEAGMATGVDVLSVKVHISAIQEQQSRHKANLEVARAALNDAMGIALDTPHTLTTKLAALPVTQQAIAALEDSSVANRPETRQAVLGVNLSATQKADARSNQLKPDVGIHGAFEADRQRFYDRGGANWLASIGLRWNLFNGFADKARVQESVAAERQSKAEQQRADSAVRLQVRRAWADLQAAQQRIDAASATIDEAQETLRVTQNRYEAGLSTVTDLLRTEAALIDTRTRHIAAIHDQRVAAVMLEWSAGTLTSDSEVLN